MNELIAFFRAYSFSEIITFFLFGIVASISLVKIYQEVKGFFESFSKKRIAEKDREDEIKNRFEKIEQEMIELRVTAETADTRAAEEVDKMRDLMDFLSDKIEILIDSDKDSIKAYLTDKHHYYYYDKGWIDDYNLDCIERRYIHYKKSGGNSFIDQIMNELRQLPRRKPDMDK